MIAALLLALITAPAPSLAQPSLSPDAREIAFVSGGNIWTVPSSGGAARLLVDDGATDERPIYSPDGRSIAYISSKTGNGDIYVLSLASGRVSRLTYDDGYDELDGFSPDGRWIYFANSSRNIYGAHDIYRVRVSGGTPMRVVTQPYMNVYLSAPSPKDGELAFNARGFAGSQWWRKGHSHLDDCEIWLRHSNGTYQRVTAGEAKDEWPMWSVDGSSLYYMSDRTGTQNLWRQQPGGRAEQMTHFRDGRVVWPSIARNGSAIVFERGFGIWRYDTHRGTAAQVPISLEGAVEMPHETYTTAKNRFDAYALSPDGKKIAFVTHGRLFAADAQNGGTAQAVPLGTDYALGSIAWSPDSNSVAFTAGHGHEGTIETYDFLNGVEHRLTTTPADVKYLQYRPREAGGPEEIAFEQGAHEVRSIDVVTKQVRTLASADLPWSPGEPDRPLQWSPDGRWLAFFANEPQGFTNVHVIDAANPQQRPISFLANVFTNTISWDPQGKFLLFDTTQRTEPAQVARVDLVPRTPVFEESKFNELFTGVRQTNAAQRSNPETHPRVRVAFQKIRERLQLLDTGVDVQSQSISPDGKSLLLSASAAGQTNLYIFPLSSNPSEDTVAHQLTRTAGDKNLPAWAPDGKHVYYLDGDGAVHIVAVDDGKDSPLALTAEFQEDWNRDKVEAFTQAWSAIRDFYADPHTNGVNWNAVRDKYTSRIAGAQTPDEFRRLLSLMIGELNSSHTGVYSPSPAKRTSGRLGLDFDRAVYEDSGRLRVTNVVPQSPAAISGEIHAGDELAAVNGTRIDARVNLDELLDNTIGKRVVLRIRSAGSERDVAVQPVNYATAMALRYRAWVEANRAYVLRASGGRLGYVHMPDMSAESLANLYKDLDVTDYDKQGVVVDVRSNEGGFVNAYAIDVFARRPYLRMYPRNEYSASARTELGQRALEKPTVLMVNEETLSDGEDFTQGYRALHLGKVVGVPTAGWIIYTSAIRLVDGTTFRIPFERVTTLSGENMEMHPRPVDVYVTRPVGSSTDPQLDTAVRTLLRVVQNHT
jgi:Tol biopolymer transport system component/C-terminal processing protease CtpA/Prc